MQTIDYKPVSLAGSRWEKTVLTGPLPEPEPEHEKDEDGTTFDPEEQNEEEHPDDYEGDLADLSARDIRWRVSMYLLMVLFGYTMMIGALDR